MDDRVAKKSELKVIKQQMSQTSDPEVLRELKKKYQIVDVQQLAKKVAINGIYGGLAANTNSLGTWPIAACVTAQGRAVIRECKAFVE
jgi:DNA polymerase elongation subunit (family B)